MNATLAGRCPGPSSVGVGTRRSTLVHLRGNWHLATAGLPSSSFSKADASKIGRQRARRMTLGRKLPRRLVLNVLHSALSRSSTFLFPYGWSTSGSEGLGLDETSCLLPARAGGGCGLCRVRGLLNGTPGVLTSSGCRTVGLWPAPWPWSWRGECRAKSSAAQSPGEIVAVVQTRPQPRSWMFGSSSLRYSWGPHKHEISFFSLVSLGRRLFTFYLVTPITNLHLHLSGLALEFARQGMLLGR